MNEKSYLELCPWWVGGFTEVQEDLTVALWPTPGLYQLWSQALYSLRAEQELHTWTMMSFLKGTSQKPLFPPEFSLSSLLSILIISKNVMYKEERMVLALELGEKDDSITT